jgi:hypothetical protein
MRLPRAKTGGSSRPTYTFHQFVTTSHKPSEGSLHPHQLHSVSAHPRRSRSESRSAPVDPRRPGDLYSAMHLGYLYMWTRSEGVCDLVADSVFRLWRLVRSRLLDSEAAGWH